MGDIDGIICEDDAITRKVTEKALPELKVVNKYGIGAERINLKAARELGLIVTYTPGVNEVAVAEDGSWFIVSLARNIPRKTNGKGGDWKRITVHELFIRCGLENIILTLYIGSRT